jgi:hypothetical protein
MSRSCTICPHPQKREIDASLVTGLSVRKTAAKYGVSYDALLRHKAGHLPATLARAHEAREAARAGRLLDEARDLQARTLNALRTAESEGDLRTALIGVREARRMLELLARLLGAIEERPSPSPLLSQEWIAVRTAILEALAQHPEARNAVVTRLLALEAAGTPPTGPPAP